VRLSVSGLAGDFSAEASPTAWDEDLTPEQRDAAGSSGMAHRMLAGPGTGKTRVMTHHVLYLVQEKGVQPDDILILTFTRAATFELRKRIRIGLGEGGGLPRIYTLHAFALSQLMRNKQMMRDQNQPLRIADDWEQRWIIEEDIKALTGKSLEEVRENFARLSADWSTLNADADDWKTTFPDSAFLAAWTEHRTIFGYSLRAELVYRLKRCIQEFGDKFALDRSSHLLVDEYQDLNPCDLAIVRHLVEAGAEPYVAGDDDQSIYGFRHAFPLGIRKYADDYAPCAERSLTVCKRCDESILRLGLFVAEQDYERIPKTISHEEGREGGEVKVLRFGNQFDEADGVARICRSLIDRGSYSPHDLLILVRSDSNRAISSVLKDSLTSQGITVAASTGGTPLDSVVGRKTLNVLRLASNPDDHLALRSLLYLSTGIGDKAFSQLYAIAKEGGETFSSAARKVVADPTLVSHTGPRIRNAATFVWALAEKVKGDLADLEAPSVEKFRDYVTGVARAVQPDAPELDELVQYLQDVIIVSDSKDLDSLFHAIQSISDDVDNLIQVGKVNIMTMHKAKGLTSPVVLVVGADDGFLPGRNESGPPSGDERRLLYVSLTRAQHYLYVTYATDRLYQQSFYGRQDSDARRLTRFLREGPVAPVDGQQYSMNPGFVTAR
jgi:DNA helicase-2/ATP-dependent DNA helicase PcrA